MKTKPQPATVEDATEAGEAILHSKQTAIRVRKPSLARHNSNNHNQQETTIIGRSICKGSVKEALETFTGEQPMTIFSPSEDHSRERNEVKGHCVRKIFFRDEKDVLSPTTTVVHQRPSKRNKKERDYITLTAFVPNKDEEHPDPKIYVEQRTYRKKDNDDGLQQEERTVVQQLIFGQNIRLGVTYVFKGCGDERRAIGGEEEDDDDRQKKKKKKKKRDLHVRFFSLEQTMFDKYWNSAKYHGYDVDQEICIKAGDLHQGLLHRLPAPAPAAVPAPIFRVLNTIDRDVESNCSISINGNQLQALFVAKQRSSSSFPVSPSSSSSSSSSSSPSPHRWASNKGPSHGGDGGEVIELLTMTLHGFGHANKWHVGVLDLRILVQT